MNARIRGDDEAKQQSGSLISASRFGSERVAVGSAAQAHLAKTVGAGEASSRPQHHDNVSSCATLCSSKYIH